MMDRPFRQEWSQQVDDSGTITATACVPGDSAWFSGHFPGHPILPGIAVLGLVEQAIQAAETAEGRRIAITGVGRVRFRMPAGPGDRMEIRISREPRRGGWAYAFTVTLAGEPVCSGILTAALISGPQGQPRNKLLDKGGHILQKSKTYRSYDGHEPMMTVQCGGSTMPESQGTRVLMLRVAQIIIEELKLEDITPETFDPEMDLVDELGVDSMDLATVALVLQDEYGVTIDEDDYPALKSVRLIVEYIGAKLAAGRQG
jgi:acyl carrier protein